MVWSTLPDDGSITAEGAENMFGEVVYALEHHCATVWPAT